MIPRLIYIELYKIFRKWRTYIGFIAIGVLVPLIHFSFYTSSGEGSKMALRSLGEAFMFSGNLMNGYFVTYLILNSLFVHVPFLIVLVGGDLLAGEATGGTYRMLVIRPASRFQILTSKFLAGIIYTFSLILFLAIMSLGLGLLIFGSGVLAVLSDKIIIFAENDILWRFFGAFSFAVLSMSVITSMAFFFSSLVENAIGPIVTTMAILIIFFILSVIPIDMLQGLKPYLFTTYLPGWLLFFNDPIDTANLAKSAAVLLGHIAVFYTAALIIFRRKDILS